MLRGACAFRQVIVNVVMDLGEFEFIRIANTSSTAAEPVSELQDQNSYSQSSHASSEENGSKKKVNDYFNLGECKEETFERKDDIDNILSKSEQHYTKMTVRDNDETVEVKSSFKIIAKFRPGDACQYCGKRFLFSCSLKQHEMTHTRERPHRCDSCPKAFTKKNDLTRHQMIHGGKRPFTCPECQREFGRRYQLTEHIRTHTGEKPYKCQLCVKKFTSRSQRRTHLKSKHPSNATV